MVVFKCGFIIIIFIYCHVSCISKENEYNLVLRARNRTKYIPEEKSSNKYANPGLVKDRHKDESIFKPIMPERFENRFQQPFTPAWMDYCDPYHCNDYHYTRCGVNRKNKKFKWFQSACHLILNNQCSDFRGALKYDMVDNKYCRIYVMYLRQGCTTDCHDHTVNPVCAFSLIYGNFMLFKNECAMRAASCQSGVIDEYEPVYMGLCEYYLRDPYHYLIIQS